MTTLLPCIETTSGPKPEAAVIWLHGLGADGNDFAAIVPELDLGGCVPIRFVFPHAPSMPVTINGGYVMPAWYDILGSEMQKVEDEAGIRRSALAIEALIAREQERGIAPGRIVLAGFSQGCAIALHTGLRHPTRLAGIMALSGYLPLAGKLPAEASPANRQLPIFMAHGVADPMIVLARAEASRDGLKALAYPVQWHTYPMQHSLHPREIQDISLFLQSVLGPQEHSSRSPGRPKDDCAPSGGQAKPGLGATDPSPGRPKDDCAPSGGQAKPGLGATDPSPGRPKDDCAPSGGQAKPGLGAP